MKKGQMQISFGMIFSIILIMVFISAVIYVIIYFLNFSERVKIEQFEEGLQESVDNIWKSVQGSKSVKLALPKEIEKVCFIDSSSNAVGKDRELYNDFVFFITNENLIYYPEGSSQGKEGTEIKHLNISRITQKRNPYCIEGKKGDFSFIVKMDYSENLVRIEEE